MYSTLNIIIFFIISILFIIPLLYVIKKYDVIKLKNNRIVTLDGLRGYLAIGVFLIHYLVTYQWTFTGIWMPTSLKIFNNIGQASVSLFFIMTGYLFAKTIKSKRFQTKSFLIKRFFRIVPLYYFVVLVVLFIVFYKQNFKLYEDLPHVLFNTVEWLLFLRPDINGFQNTFILVSGVTWTLVYDLIFYLFLPIVFYLKRHNRLTLYIFLFFLIYIGINNLEINLVYIKLYGIFFILYILGYLISELERAVKGLYNFDNNIISTINIIIIIFTITYFKEVYSLIPFLLLSIVFTFIALGNSIFGILTLDYSRILGELSYGVYLLHGLIIYIIIDFLHKESLPLYFMPITLFIIITFALFTFKFIEHPLNEYGHKLSKTKDLRKKRHV